MKVLVDGKIVSRDEVQVDIEDRGYQFGDGVYEVINIYNGIPFTIEEHTKRLYRSAKEIGLTMKDEPDKLMQDLIRLIEENKMGNGGLYLQITRGVAPRTHQYQGDITPRFVAYPLPYKDLEASRTNGVPVITAEDLRWLRCDIKSLNLLYNVMMKQKAYENDAFEAILVRDGIVTEGTSSNVFLIKDDTIFTHPANNKILNGITRIKLLQVLEENDWAYREEPFTKEDLLQADEVFVTSTTSEVVPVISIDGIRVSNGAPGQRTNEIQKAFSALIQKETAR